MKTNRLRWTAATVLGVGIVAALRLAAPTPHAPVTLVPRSAVPAAPVTAEPAAPLQPLVMAAAPAAPPPQRLVSFERAPDAWDLANAARQSNDPAVVFEAAFASRECVGLVSVYATLQVLASGGTTKLPGPLTAERQQAIAALAKKCAGFLKVGFKDSRKLMQELDARGQAIGGPEFTPPKNPTDAQAFEYLARLGSPAARSRAVVMLGDLADHAIAGDGAVTPEHEKDVSAAAAVLAQCELGMDCSASGYAAQIACSYQGQCGAALWDGWNKDLTPAEAGVALRTRDQLVEKVRQAEGRR